MKKLITYVTTAALLMGSMCTTVYGATFADIDTVTWSGFKPFLNEAAELGLMSGYEENGKRYCKPRNNVTYCEAVQLMYSIMKVYSGQDVSDATVTKWKPVMSAYNIPSWAYRATAYSLDNSILSTSELSNLQANAQGINEKRASREAVGVIFGKALDTVNGYDIKSNASLTYADKSQVSAAAVPYLELLNRAELMVGDTDNKFNPKANITRAEMAVLSVKTYNKLTEAPAVSQDSLAVGSVTSSMIMANGDLFLTMKTNSGAGLNLFAEEDEVTPKYNDQKIDFEDIKAGDTVKVKYNGQHISELEVVYSKYGIDQTTEVTYELVAISSSKVTVLEGSKEVDYRLDDKVSVKLDGEKSSVSSLRSAVEDANYDVTLTLDSDEYVLAISAMMNANNPTEGYVTDLEDDKITIKAGSKEYTYPLAEDLFIEYNGKEVKFSKFEDDYEEYNYQVSLELNKSNEVDEIIIESMEDEYSGTLTFINSNRISFEAGSEDYSYDLADDVVVKIDGKTSSVATLRSNFQDDKNYTVAVDLDRYDDVTEIIATSKFSNNNDGKLKEIDSREIKIVVDDKEYTYDLNSDVDVTINGKNRDVEDLEDYLGEYSFVVDLEFDNDGDVTKIKATLTEAAEGELKDIVESTDTLTISAAGLTLDLELASSVDITLNDEDISLTDLNDELDHAYRNEWIYVELEYNKNGLVDKVDAYWENVHGELQDVDTKDDEIKVDGDWYVMLSRADYIYKLSSAVDADDYRSLNRYSSSIDGLEDFLADCDAANDDCEVALTLDKNDDVVRIKVTAK